MDKKRMHKYSLIEESFEAVANTNTAESARKLLRGCFAIGGILSVVGCSNIPYAIVDGSRSKVSDIHSSNVIITGVNGKMHFDLDATKNLEPGLHTIRLTSTRLSRRGGRQSHREIQIDAKPCKRYLVAAKHDKDKRFSHKHWKVEVVRIEDIPWCKVPKDDG